MSYDRQRASKVHVCRDLRISRPPLLTTWLFSGYWEQGTDNTLRYRIEMLSKGKDRPT